MRNLSHKGHEVTRRKALATKSLRGPSCSWWFMVFVGGGNFGACPNLRLHTQRPQSPLQSSEHKVGEERQQRGRNSSRQNHLVVDHGQSAKNKFSESACADRCRDRCQPNGEHRRNSQSGDNDSRGQRQLHLEEQLAIGQSHGASRLDHRWIDAANASVSITNQGQELIERQRQDCKATAALSNPRRRKKKAEQGKTRDGLDYVRATQHRL